MRGKTSEVFRDSSQIVVCAPRRCSIFIFFFSHPFFIHASGQFVSRHLQSSLCHSPVSLLIWDKLFHHHISKIGGKKAFYVNADQLSDSLVYIHKNYHQNITLEELAEYAHLSEGQFCRSFKELTGMTPFRYLIRYRILQSCNQLLLTDKKVTEIALSCGFNNISYYNRAFFKIMRMTPTEYRKTTEKNSTFII